ncbi:RNA-binding protein 44 isoform X1 [Epinephelus lanceolatus]
MEPHWSTAAYSDFRTVSHTQPMAVFQTVWPAFPITLPEEQTVHRLPYAVAPLPCYYNMVIGGPSPTEIRKLFLNRSVFDLVDAHICLALTDPRLLGWYLSLCPEDRRIIQDDGGFNQFLQRHPALELSRHHVYVRKTPRTHPDMEVPPRVRETLTLLGRSNRGDGSPTHPHEGIYHTKQQVHQQDHIQTTYVSPVTQERTHQKAHSVRGSTHVNEPRPSQQMASCSSSAAVRKDPTALVSFSLDVELERCRQGGQPELRSQTAVTQCQCAECRYAEVSPLHSEVPTAEKGSSLEFCSFDSNHMDAAEYNDESVSSPLDPAEENSTVEGCQDYVVNGNEYTEDNDEGILTFEDHMDSFHSIMEDDKSIVVCVSSKDVKACNNGVQSGPVTADSEAAGSEMLKSDQTVIKKKTTERYTSPVPCVSTCDIMVSTEPLLCTSAVTQTDDPETADKHVITEVHMADLDYLAEEFIKLSTAQQELRALKENRESSGCQLRKECDCVHRAQQAELSLLALQYSMCRHYCWSLCCTSADGGQLNPKAGNPAVDIVSALQKLEADFNQMRERILSGVPLEQLNPLTVDFGKVTTAANYTPAQTTGDVLGIVPSCSSQEPQKQDTSGDENRRPCNQSRSGSQVKKEESKSRRAVTLIPQGRDATHRADKPEEKQTKSECKELNTSEAWYDAEEDLECAGPVEAADTGQDPAVNAEDNESASEEVKSSVLCVSNLPRDVTESDVMQWFEKYHPTEVSILALKNDLRVAIVIVSGVHSAEAAVRELNGCCMEGRTLHVKHINRASDGSQSQASASVSGPEPSQEAAKPQNSNTHSSSSERELITRPPLSSSIKTRKVVCISPTAKGICVPQHYGTMGSFETLMAELTQLHPDVGRQRIVDALLKLKAKHQGVLSGLPLRTIREMISELLTRPARATQS